MKIVTKKLLVNTAAIGLIAFSSLSLAATGTRVELGGGVVNPNGLG